jgi:transposase-like protein
VAGRRDLYWCYLYRAIDSTGATVDFLLSVSRDAAAAQRLFRQALYDPSHLCHPPSNPPAFIYLRESARIRAWACDLCSRKDWRIPRGPLIVGIWRILSRRICLAPSLRGPVTEAG